MIFKETDLPGAFLVDIEQHRDERGFFARSFCQREFSDHGLETDFPQCSISWNARRGTLRGLHYQAKPHREAKLVRCTAGAIYDVIVDLRQDSPTRLRWLGIQLTADSRGALYVPKDFAHGFVTLVDEVEVFYQISEPFAPSAARGLRWDDPELAVTWPIEPEVISARDREWPLLNPETFWT